MSIPILISNEMKIIGDWMPDPAIFMGQEIWKGLNADRGWDDNCRRLGNQTCLDHLEAMRMTCALATRIFHRTGDSSRMGQKA